MKRRSFAVARDYASHSTCASSSPKKKSALSERAYDWPVYSGVMLAAMLAYVNGMGGAFVHDDIPAIVTNGDVLGTRPLSQLFTNDFWGMPMSDVNSHKSYRPLTTLTFRWTHAWCGQRAVWYHACNALLHACACALVARAARHVARLRRPFSAVAGLLFAVHPVHTEAVTGIVGRADVLSCIFFLSSVLVYHGSNGAHHVWSSIILGALSMLAKETGVTVFLLNLVFDIYRCWPSIRRTLLEVKWNKKTARFSTRATKLLISLVILISARLALLQGSLPSFSQQDNPAAFHPNIYVRSMTFCYLVAFNLWLLLCPLSLSHDWQMGSVPLVTSVTDSRNLLTCAAFGALLYLIHKCLLDSEHHRQVPLVLAMLTLVLPFLPASNLFVTVGFVIAERVLYIPSLGSVLITVYGAQLMWKSRTSAKVLVCLGIITLLLSGTCRTLQRNKDWRTKETLLRADLNTLPHNAKLHYNYANFLRDMDHRELAIKHYNEALRLWPSYASAHNNLGTVTTDARAAEQHFLRAIQHSRDHVNAHYNLGKLYRKSNKISEALVMLERCITLEPRFIELYIELAIIKPDHEKGAILRRVIELEPDNWEHYLMYARWLSSQGLHVKALSVYMQAVQRSAERSGGGQEDLPALRGAAATLRKIGHRSRMLQLLTRWHTCRRSRSRSMPSPAASNVYLREWRLRTELAKLADVYAHAQLSHNTHDTRTCLDHTQLEISKDSASVPAGAGVSDKLYKNKPSIQIHLNTYQQNSNHHKPVDRASKPETESEKYEQSMQKCVKTCIYVKGIGTKSETQHSGTLSIATNYKPTHNKSESSHKQKDCSNQGQNKKERKSKMQYNSNEPITPLLTEHLIQTF